MNLTHKMVNLEPDVLTEIKKLDPGFNLSSKIRDYLRSYKCFITANSFGFDVELLHNRKKKIEKSINEASAELNLLNDQIYTLAQEREEEEQKRLQKEKELAEKKITCIVCGIPKVEEKLKNFPQGMVCKTCFMSADKGTLKKFMRGQKK